MAYQAGNIKSVKANVIEVYHPDLLDIGCHLTASVSAAGTTLTVNSNNGLSQNDFYVIGKVGYSKTEIKKINASVTAGTSLTTTAVTFDHSISIPVQKKK